MNGRYPMRYHLGQAPNVDPANFAAYRTQRRQTPEDYYQPIYDRVNYAAAGATSLSFFTVPIGGSATLIRAGTAASVAKTLRDTNMRTAGVLASKAFMLFGMSVCYIPLQQAVAGAATQRIFDDIQLLVFGGYLVYTLLDKPYLEVPLNLIPGTGVIRGSVGGAFTAGNVAVAAGGPGPGGVRDVYPVKIPLGVDPFQGFALTMNWDGTVALGQTFDLQIFLHGMIRRPTQ